MGEVCSECVNKESVDVFEVIEIPQYQNPNLSKSRTAIPIEPSQPSDLQLPSSLSQKASLNPSSMFIPKSQKDRHKNIPITPPSMIANTILIKRIQSESNNLWVVPEFASNKIGSQEITRQTQLKIEEKSKEDV